MLHHPAKDPARSDVIVLPGASDHEIAGDCTGAAIDGGVLTAAHCTHDDAELVVHTPDATDVTAKLVRLDALLDVALLAPATPLPRALRIPLASSVPPAGASVAALGTTRFGFPMFATGITVGPTDALGPRYLVDFVAWPGLSGGPVVVAHGSDMELAGIATGWLAFDADGHARMLEMAPVDRIADFLAGKPSPEGVRASTWAAARRHDTYLSFDAHDEPRSAKLDERKLHLTPHLERDGAEIEGTITVDVFVDGNRTTRAEVGARDDLELPRARTQLGEVRLVARAPGLEPETFALNRNGVVVPTRRLRFDVSTDRRKADDPWLGFVWSVAATEGFRGHAVVLRPIVMRAGTSDVVGVGNECYFADVRETSELECNDLGGRVWAPAGGSYDVVLASGTTPVAYFRWEIAPPEPSR
jgi:hypothetical protein